MLWWMCRRTFSEFHPPLTSAYLAAAAGAAHLTWLTLSFPAEISESHLQILLTLCSSLGTHFALQWGGEGLQMGEDGDGCARSGVRMGWTLILHDSPHGCTPE